MATFTELELQAEMLPHERCDIPNDHSAHTYPGPMGLANFYCEGDADTPIELPVTVLGEVAALIREAQGLNIDGCSPEIINDKLSQALILVDVLRGDGQ